MFFHPARLVKTAYAIRAMQPEDYRQAVEEAAQSVAALRQRFLSDDGAVPTHVNWESIGRILAETLSMEVASVTAEAPLTPEQESLCPGVLIDPRHGVSYHTDVCRLVVYWDRRVLWLSVEVAQVQAGRLLCLEIESPAGSSVRRYAVLRDDRHDAVARLSLGQWTEEVFSLRAYLSGNNALGDLDAGLLREGFAIACRDDPASVEAWRAWAQQVNATRSPPHYSELWQALIHIITAPSPAPPAFRDLAPLGSEDTGSAPYPASQWAPRLQVLSEIDGFLGAIAPRTRSGVAAFRTLSHMPCGFSVGRDALWHVSRWSKRPEGSAREFSSLISWLTGGDPEAFRIDSPQGIAHDSPVVAMHADQAAIVAARYWPEAIAHRTVDPWARFLVALGDSHRHAPVVNAGHFDRSSSPSADLPCYDMLSGASDSVPFKSVLLCGMGGTGQSLVSRLAVLGLKRTSRANRHAHGDYHDMAELRWWLPTQQSDATQPELNILSCWPNDVILSATNGAPEGLEYCCNHLDSTQLGCPPVSAWVCIPMSRDRSVLRGEEIRTLLWPSPDSDGVHDASGLWASLRVLGTPDCSRTLGNALRHQAWEQLFGGRALFEACHDAIQSATHDVIGMAWRSLYRPELRRWLREYCQTELPYPARNVDSEALYQNLVGLMVAAVATRIVQAGVDDQELSKGAVWEAWRQFGPDARLLATRRRRTSPRRSGSGQPRAAANASKALETLLPGMTAPPQSESSCVSAQHSTGCPSVTIARDLALRFMGRKRCVVRSLDLPILGSADERTGFLVQLHLELLAGGHGELYADPLVMGFTPTTVQFRNAVDIAWTVARRELADAVTVVPSHDVRWRFKGAALTLLDGGSWGAALAIGLILLNANIACPKGWAIMAAVNEDGDLLPVGGIREKMLAAWEMRQSRGQPPTIVVHPENAADARDCANQGPAHRRICIQTASSVADVLFKLVGGWWDAPATDRRSRNGDDRLHRAR